jgi:hypothetical protein
MKSVGQKEEAVPHVEHRQKEEGWVKHADGEPGALGRDEHKVQRPEKARMVREKRRK